jgi:hypothetical protein
MAPFNCHPGRNKNIIWTRKCCKVPTDWCAILFTTKVPISVLMKHVSRRKVTHRWDRCLQSTNCGLCKSWSSVTFMDLANGTTNIDKDLAPIRMRNGCSLRVMQQVIFADATTCDQRFSCTTGSGNIELLFAAKAELCACAGRQ